MPPKKKAKASTAKATAKAKALRAKATAKAIAAKAKPAAKKRKLETEVDPPIAEPPPDHVDGDDAGSQCLC